MKSTPIRLVMVVIAALLALLAVTPQASAATRGNVTEFEQWANKSNVWTSATSMPTTRR